MAEMRVSNTTETNKKASRGYRLLNDRGLSRLRLGGITWVVQRELLEKLRPDFFLQLTLESEMQGCQIVKVNKVRKIMLLRPPELKGRALFIKCYKYHDLPNFIKHLFLPSKARREWRNSRILMDKGIPTSRGLGFGEQRRLGVLKASYYITESIDGGVDLAELRKTGLNFSYHTKRQIIHQSARLLIKLHSQDIFHSDLHLSNIIVSGKKQVEYSLSLVDLHAVRKVRRIKKSQVLKNLVQLNDAARGITRTDKLRFLQSYGDGNKGLYQELCSQMRKIQERTEKCRSARLRKRTKGCLKGKFVFNKLSRKGLVIYHRQDFEQEKILQAIHNYKNASCGDDIKFLKTDASRTVLTLPLMAQEDGSSSYRTAERICIKHFRYRGLLHALKDLFVIPRGKRSWISGNAFTIRGIPTSKPLALVEERKFCLLKNSFLLMEDISVLSNLPKYISSNFTTPSCDISQKRQFIKAMGSSLAQLHQMGIYHRDLKGSNILVEKTGCSWKFHYIDLDGVKVGKKVSLRHRAKNLAQIDNSIRGFLTATDRMRFLRHYSECTNHSSRKQFIKDVLSQARQYAQPNRAGSK